jgi:hypothetical protein
MPARDAFHRAVKQGLIAQGWTITKDPLIIQFGGADMYVDLAAEKIIAAEREGQRIAVEIKSFMGASVLNEFHAALGQFLNYRLALEATDPERELYLAVPDDIYANFFMLPFAQMVMKRHALRLIVYEADREVIVEWIN